MSDRLGTHLSCGRSLHFCADISESLSENGQMGYDFISIPIVNPRNRREFALSPAKNRNENISRADVILAADDWSRLIVGKVSPWIDVDSDDPDFRRQSEKALIEELEYMCHLQLPAVEIQLKSKKCVNLASIMSYYVTKVTKIPLFWVCVPMVSKKKEVKAMGHVANDDDSLLEPPPPVLPEGRDGKLMVNGGVGHDDDSDGDNKGDDDDPWEWWNVLRTLCNFHRRVGLVLEVTEDLPSSGSCSRWLGEVLKCVVVPTHLFVTNKKGFPVLTKQHQGFIKQALKLDVQLLVSGQCYCEEKGMGTYQQYLEHLNRNRDELDPVERFARGFEDFLQIPLQPLSDNLESHTYEIFEKDPVKYSEYQKAIYKALKDTVKDDERKTKEIIVMVLGAGRGPLIQAALTAAGKAQRKIKIIALEKNPNAVITLRHRNKQEWDDRVEIFCDDMRHFSPAEKADMIISELLGSFGDNELSPECLDGAQRYLKDGGVSIPTSYTSYLSPLQSSKLHQEVSSSKQEYKHPEANFECPYVVRLHNRLELCDAQPLFTFHHPNYDSPIDNTRKQSLKFGVSQKSVLTGFAGYFHCTLYKDVVISIVPSSHSPGMFSWFPAYFPIQTPIQLTSGDTVEVHFWRKVNKQEVWYEWAVTEPTITPIHNLAARSYSIKLA